ncbi:MAG: hypothetical protein ACYCX4_09700 [Bacillota bacterium]
MKNEDQPCIQEESTQQVPQITFNRPGAKYRILGNSSAYPDARYLNPPSAIREVPLIIPNNDRDNSGLI